jgi:hypothetical protein
MRSAGCVERCPPRHRKQWGRAGPRRAGERVARTELLRGLGWRRTVSQGSRCSPFVAPFQSAARPGAADRPRHLQDVLALDLLALGERSISSSTISRRSIPASTPAESNQRILANLVASPVLNATGQPP